MPPKRRSPKKSSSPRRSSSQGGSSGFWAWLAKVFFLCVIWGALLVGGFVAYCALDLPDFRQVVQPKKRPSITLLADDGTVFARFGDMYGDAVSVSTVPKDLPHAIIAIEDRRFYKHFGVDVLGIFRAAVRNVVAGHLVQGGSTLSQQLAKNLFLTPNRTAKRKVQEMILALQLEQHYTKDEILSAYMNRVYLGSGSFGVDAAARTYFNKPAAELNLRESAIIAGLLRAPSRYAPTRDPALAMQRAKTVLQAMVEEGYITDKQRRAAIASSNAPSHKPGPAGDGRYFADWVADQIEPFVQDTSQDIVVKTTLNMNMERAAERHIDATLAKDNREVGQAALVTIAPDGAVKALVGGRSYAESQYNRATQAMRQPGSSFKPIVYLAAIEQGLTPDDVLLDAPLRLGHWSPENVDGKYRGNVTARQALAESINTVAVRVFQQAGAMNVINAARALGITSDLERDPALALGASEVTPLEMTTAYASLAAGGRAVVPYAIEEISNRQGEVLFRRSEASMPQAVSEGAVSTLVDMMQEVVRSGTGKRASLGDRAVAGKTGTSSDYRDAWFIGFTGNYTTGVWVGNDDNAPMKKVTGGSLPAALWHDYMVEIESGIPARPLLSGSDWTSGVSSAVSKGFSDFISGILGQ